MMDEEMRVDVYSRDCSSVSKAILLREVSNELTKRHVQLATLDAKSPIIELNGLLDGFKRIIKGIASTLWIEPVTPGVANRTPNPLRHSNGKCDLLRGIRDAFSIRSQTAVLRVIMSSILPAEAFSDESYVNKIQEGCLQLEKL
ncbi:hypothetical protein DPMN_070596 [Dreissena polymorpha]|uniref:Uncharacterized protein n=1 Tax=Dreissena polymorpha TaxID=45954 RepID=A0A9D3Z5L1_DREPO|nr:hypothetical protein DPMN_070596 [Dreissena polymorpha]